MKKYEDFEIEEFFCDEFFIDWVLNPAQEHIQFWNVWLEKHPDRHFVVAQARSIITAINVDPISAELSGDEINAMIAYIKAFKAEEIDTQKPFFSFKTTLWLKISAIILMVLTGTLFYLIRHVPSRNSASNLVSNNINYRNNGSETKLIRMADGSLAILQPNSTLSFPRVFKGLKREVSLMGEAFFEVHKDPSKPFFVYSKNMVTRVLGTSFTVRAFGNEKDFKVIVNTGKVLVYSNNHTSYLRDSSVTLLPNQKVTYNREPSVFHTDTLNKPLPLSKAVAKRELSFSNTPLPIVIRKLEEVYHVRIAYDAEKFGKTSLTASLSNLPLDEKIKLICKAINAHCDFTNGEIVILESASEIK